MKHLPHNVKKILNEQYNQQLDQKAYVVKTPCSDKHKWKEPAFVRLYQAGDQVVTCPLCGRKSLLVWSPNHENLKWNS